jgi:hypothetical protein
MGLRAKAFEQIQNWSVSAERSQGPVIPNVVDVFVESREQGCGSAVGSTSIGAGLMPLREAVSSACFTRALSAAS